MTGLLAEGRILHIPKAGATEHAPNAREIQVKSV
jgi:hypothetical protein